MEPEEILGLSPYHAGAGVIVDVGAICMLAFALLNVPCPWTGFFVGAVPTFLLFAWHFASEETPEINHDTEREIDA